MSDPGRTPNTTRSAPELLGDLMTESTDLVRAEIKLFRAEMSEKAGEVVAALGMIVAGIVLVLVSLIVLAFALVAAFEGLGLTAGWAAVLVGVIFAAIAFVLIGKGSSNLKASNLAPTRTSDSLSKDATAVKGAVS